MWGEDFLADYITERDKKALLHLQDVRCIKTTNCFELEFYFSPNPFFEDTTLKKKYNMADGVAHVLKDATATEIRWKEGKNLTVKTIEKIPKSHSSRTREKPQQRIVTPK